MNTIGANQASSKFQFVIDLYLDGVVGLRVQPVTALLCVTQCLNAPAPLLTGHLTSHPGGYGSKASEPLGDRRPKGRLSNNPAVTPMPELVPSGKKPTSAVLTQDPSRAARANS